jgi:3,4-dihydroxy-9,10-secoandrosta-1,3,5(10)-triene-9,17-dione 4,5-dioxygenase
VPVLSLGYLRLESTDLEAWQRFAGGFLGLMPVAAEGDESLRYRMDHYPPRLAGGGEQGGRHRLRGAERA